MIKMSVLYPAGEDRTFDMEYYRTTHLEIVTRVLKPTRSEIERGLDGQPFVALGHFHFESHEAMQAALADPAAGEALADLPNFTNIQPTMQFSEIVA